MTLSGTAHPSSTCRECGWVTNPQGPQWPCEWCGEMNWDGDVNAKVAAIDFDGVIHDVSAGWSRQVDGEPIPGAIEGLRRLREEGWFLVVFTARETEDLGKVRQWMYEHWDGLGVPPQVTNRKPGAKFYLDDKAVRFVGWDRFEPPE